MPVPKASAGSIIINSLSSVFRLDPRRGNDQFPSDFDGLEMALPGCRPFFALKRDDFDKSVF